MTLRIKISTYSRLSQIFIAKDKNSGVGVVLEL